MKSMVKNFLINMASLLPMLLFLNYVMGIQLLRDVGLVKTTGFITCMVIYSVGFKYAYRSK